MKLVAVFVFLAYCLAVGVDSASVSLSTNSMTLNGNAHIQFYGPREEIWNGLSDGHRYPIINSGDTIALRSSYPSGSYSKYWLLCGTSYCYWYTCPGTVIAGSKWSSCSNNMRFIIYGMGKMNGQPINSGDTVTLINHSYSSSYHFRCGTSTSYYCRMYSTTSSMNGNNWLSYYYTVFQIFSRNAVDGTPVQYGDTVAFKYPFGGYNKWLYHYGNRFNARGCSSTSKYTCAKQNKSTGFKIFKKL